MWLNVQAKAWTYLSGKGKGKGKCNGDGDDDDKGNNNNDKGKGNDKDKCNGNGKCGGLSTTAAKCAAFGRDDASGVGVAGWW